MIEKHLYVGAFQCRCQLLACSRTGKAVIIDPGDEIDRLLLHWGKLTTPNGLKIQVEYLLHTHAHFDHIGATRSWVEAAEPDVPKIALHSQDLPLYQSLKLQGQYFGFQYQDPLPVTDWLQDEELLQIGDLKIHVLHTPGHSPGSVCFRLQEDHRAGIPEKLFTGDTLFQGSVGRTDLWGGDSTLLLKSIRQRLLVLDDDLPIYPGHGAASTLGQEKRTNPFLV